MAKFTAYAVPALPTTSIDTAGVYFVKGASDPNFNIYIRRNDNSDWVSLGISDSVTEVNGLIGSVQLDLSLNANGILSLTGSSSTIDLDARYVKIGDGINWSNITDTPTTLSGYGITDAALDADVLHKTGNETKTGVLTLVDSPVVPTAVNSNQAVNKGQMDAADDDLQDQIDDILINISSGLNYKGDIDASPNPNYPEAVSGDVYFISIAGKIGGASGEDVGVGNMIIAKTDTPSGTQAAVGDNWSIIRSEFESATEAIAGIIRIATQAEVNAGSDHTTAVTPLTLQVKLNALTSTNDGKYVRYDASQTLNAGERTQARTNIGAADDATVVKLTGAQTIAGVKTFSSSPVVPTASNANQAVNLGQLNTVTDGKFVRYDTAAQGLTLPQQDNARTNISAAALADVEWGTKDW